MRIGIIGPSKVRENDKVIEVAKILARSGHEIVVTPDKDSSSEFFAQQYQTAGGRKVYSLLPLDDKEFGFSWLNTNLGEQINCGTWRNQPEKLNEETDALVCIGYAAGVLIEIAYSKWFKPKPVYIITELAEEKLPEHAVEKLDIRYVSISDLEKELK